jgi:PilZ domain
MAESRIELHGKNCSCRGGAWALLESTQRSPCSGDSAEHEKLVLGLAEWRQIGKPGSLEAFKEAELRNESGERRAFPRFEVTLRVQLARIPTWRDSSEQVEETVAEVIAVGGALVRSRMAVDKGEMVRFAIRDAYETRAEIMYVAQGAGAGMDGIQRLGLKFLDAPLPESLIPAGAQPLP